MTKTGLPKRAQGATTTTQLEFRRQLDSAKRASTLQVLFKVARLLDELALARIAEREGAPRLRRSHTSLFPHIDLDGTRMSDLAERLGVTKQAVSQLVDDLEALGVVARVPDPDDARARRVIFTERGRAGFFSGLATLRELEAELSSSIGEKRMAQLRAALLAIDAQLASHE
jgi:DNA-binding MarR family transcriptional regulator